jgi:hypothetical protein
MRSKNRAISSIESMVRIARISGRASITIWYSRIWTETAASKARTVAPDDNAKQGDLT